MKKIVAIIPAYNEAERIGNVLKALQGSELIDEIIVVDDGSQDNTREVVKQYKVKYLKNKQNKGKGYSMSKGVKKSGADIIFFCDADLTGLTSDMVDSIIRPVVEGKKDMFLGRWKRNGKEEVFSLLTGQRALKRGVWEKLPEFYKHKYRIEAGLNKFVKDKDYSWGYKFFSYGRVKKRKKSGLIKGIFKSMLMYLGVLLGFIAYIFKLPLIKRKYKQVKNENFICM